MLTIYRIDFDWFDPRSYVLVLKGGNSTKAVPPGTTAKRELGSSDRITVPKQRKRVSITQTPAMRLERQGQTGRATSCKAPDLHRGSTSRGCSTAGRSGFGSRVKGSCRNPALFAGAGCVVRTEVSQPRRGLPCSRSAGRASHDSGRPAVSCRVEATSGADRPRNHPQPGPPCPASVSARVLVSEPERVSRSPAPPHPHARS